MAALEEAVELDTSPDSERARGDDGAQFRLLYERAHEPSDESPILYRERAYRVYGTLPDAALEAHLEAELSLIREAWRERDAPQFVQLAMFDHDFEGEPESPPLATLSWKDWHGRTDVWIRGVRRWSLPVAGGAEPGEREVFGDATASPAAREVTEDAATSGSRRALAEDALADAGLGQAPLHEDALEDSDDPELDREEPLTLPGRASTGSARAPKASDSGTSWSAPSRSGEYLVPATEMESVPPPSSERVLASEEVLGALFERMHELLYLSELTVGAEYVLATLEEFVACDAALVHVYDDERGEFVVLRATGPHAERAVGLRLVGEESHLAAALQSEVVVELPKADIAEDTALWQALSLDPTRVLLGGVHLGGRCLGAIQLTRGEGSEPFNPTHRSALAYVTEQFADFVINRPLTLGGGSRSRS